MSAGSANRSGDIHPSPRYVIYHERYEFRGDAAYFSTFDGTWRELLLHVNGLTEDDVWLESIGDTIPALHVRGIVDEQLKIVFDQANGDGQPWVAVYDTHTGQTVLGKDGPDA